jgi:hypothetical protein
MWRIIVISLVIIQHSMGITQHLMQARFLCSFWTMEIISILTIQLQARQTLVVPLSVFYKANLWVPCQI